MVPHWPNPSVTSFIKHACRTYGYNGYAAHCRLETTGDRFAIAASINLENNNAGVVDIVAAVQRVIIETLIELAM